VKNSSKLSQTSDSDIGCSSTMTTARQWFDKHQFTRAARLVATRYVQMALKIAKVLFGCLFTVTKLSLCTNPYSSNQFGIFVYERIVDEYHARFGYYSESARVAIQNAV